MVAQKLNFLYYFLNFILKKFKCTDQQVPRIVQ